MSCVHIVLSFASACTGADVRGLGGEQECTLTGHSNYVTSVAYSPDGKHIVSGSGDRTVKIWDTAMGEEASHRVFPSLYYLAAVCTDADVRIWSMGRSARSRGTRTTCSRWLIRRRASTL